MTKTICDICGKEMSTTKADKILLVKFPYYVKPDKRKAILDDILKSKESGVIFLPYGAEVFYISNDTLIAVEDAGKKQMPGRSNMTYEMAKKCIWFDDAYAVIK